MSDPATAPEAHLSEDQSRPVEGQQYIVLTRPCGCGKPVIVAADNPNISRLMARGYRQTGTVWQ